MRAVADVSKALQAFSRPPPGAACPDLENQGCPATFWSSESPNFLLSVKREDFWGQATVRNSGTPVSGSRLGLAERFSQRCCVHRLVTVSLAAALASRPGATHEISPLWHCRSGPRAGRPRNARKPFPANSSRPFDVHDGTLQRSCAASNPVSPRTDARGTTSSAITTPVAPKSICNCRHSGVSKRTVDLASAANSRRSPTAARSTVRKDAVMPYSAANRLIGTGIAARAYHDQTGCRFSELSRCGPNSVIWKDKWLLWKPAPPS
jgi:hypothetical protein